jgi:hypothetical protein
VKLSLRGAESFARWLRSFRIRTKSSRRRLPSRRSSEAD